MSDHAKPQTQPHPHQELITGLHALEAVKFGTFTLKSGAESPVYIDLRLLISDPSLMRLAAKAYTSELEALDFDRIAGIPMAGLPIGAAVALESGRPMIFPRSSVKSYGTSRSIEGHFKPGERALVLDDLILEWRQQDRSDRTAGSGRPQGQRRPGPHRPSRRRPRAIG